MPLPLAILIRNRMAALGLNLHGLAARLGYRNTNKGSRRLQGLMAGDIAGQADLLARLPGALELAPEDVATAVQANEAKLRRALRDSFVPCALLVTERRVSSQITFCALTRGEMALRIDLDTTRPRSTYARQALAEIDRRTDDRRREIPYFGLVQGFIVNYDACRAVRFDLDGQAVQILPRAVQPSASTWFVR